MRHTRLALRALPVLALGASAAAQTRVQFSIDWNSPTVGAPGCAAAVPLTEGDILEPCGGVPALGPLPTPMISITGGAGGLNLALHAGCVGHPGGTPCKIEVDAFSHGTDDRFSPNFPIQSGDLWFSVDEFAAGAPGAPALPNLVSEFPVGDGAADVMINLSPGMPPAPVPPVVGVWGHVGTLDGDGLYSGSGYTYPGVGLKEPTAPLPGPVAMGDNLDALNLQSGPALGNFFSLDAGPTFFDGCHGITGTGSAMAHGFVGGDVLVTTAAGVGLYAPAPALGLDLIGGPDSDDLDALILAENGFPGYQVSSAPYDWVGGGTDMLMFSVRRGSAVIGAPDSMFGLPIEPGDILIPPIAGGVSPFPAIWIPAENLGLATLRSTPMLPCGADELDALDYHRLDLRDCNGNNVEDTLDIVTGAAADTNQNGIPDVCEGPLLIATPYCFCAVGAPCGNVDATAGCKNSTGVGALMTAAGSSGVIPDDLVLTVSQMPTFQFGIVYMGTLQVGPLPFGDGLRCAGGNVCRLPLQNSGAAGQIVYGPGIGVLAASAGCPIIPGSTWNFQGWYRDPFGPCANGFNTSNAMQVTFW
ncbi:MAG: hypothetical protein H6828_14320 [Planctomycetes bacterium]|nr:hypothetical protein [Planctomycetota bacterium]